MRKVKFVFCLVFVLGVWGISFISAQTADDPALKPIINNFGARTYAGGAVTKAELDLIVKAGIRAPSASNRQPWHFTVVQSEELAKQMIPQVTEGNVLIVISGARDGKTSEDVILDCALATQSIYLAAQALGLGSRIYTGPVSNINSNFKTRLGLPKDHNAVAVVRIGRLPAGVDAVTSASPRNDAGQLVTYK